MFHLSGFLRKNNWLIINNIHKIYFLIGFLCMPGLESDSKVAEVFYLRLPGTPWDPIDWDTARASLGIDGQ